MGGGGGGGVEMGTWGHVDLARVHIMLYVCTVVADYFACQKFRGLANKRDTQIFRGAKFSLITSAKKKIRS